MTVKDLNMSFSGIYALFQAIFAGITFCYGIKIFSFHIHMEKINITKNKTPDWLEIEQDTLSQWENSMAHT